MFDKDKLIKHKQKKKGLINLKVKTQSCCFLHLLESLIVEIE